MTLRATPRLRAHRAFGRTLWWISLAAAIAAGVPAGRPAWGHGAAHLAQSAKAPPKAPPQTRQDNVTEVLHGVELVDPYRWLEDQKAPETRAWIDAQNAYTDALLAAVPGREQLKQRLTALLKVDSIGMARSGPGVTRIL